jgi:hypothetical protein
LSLRTSHWFSVHLQADISVRNRSTVPFVSGNDFEQGHREALTDTDLVFRVRR